MTSTTIVARKPFHETVVEMIRQASSQELEMLGSLLIRTTIPKDHDEIIAAWNERCKGMCWSPDSTALVANDIAHHKLALEQDSDPATSTPRYRVEIAYDMGMTAGRETHEFVAKNDNDAWAYLKENAGKSLGGIRRNVQFDERTLCRILEKPAA